MEYLNFLGNDISQLQFKCYFCKNYLYLMGINGLYHCSENKIAVYVKKRKFEVLGEKLKIKELSKKYIRIDGKICSIKIVD